MQLQKRQAKHWATLKKWEQHEQNTEDLLEIDILKYGCIFSKRKLKMDSRT